MKTPQKLAIVWFLVLCFTLPVSNRAWGEGEDAKSIENKELDKTAGDKIDAIAAQVYKTVEDARLAMERAREKFKEISQDPQTKQALEEVEKLFQLEYRVVEFAVDKSSADIEKELAQLGQQRWDCFNAVPLASKTLIYCKRRPTSYLRYLEKLL